MKKYILAICCMVFVGQAFAQVKTYFVHKKDGTTIELPVGTKKLDFSGKTVVNDDDYIHIGDIRTSVRTGVNPSVEVFVYPQNGRDGVKLETIGISISKEDEPQVEQKIYMDRTSGNDYCIYVGDLEFNASYKCRAFGTYRGKEYYSSEHSFSFGKPTMEWYQLDIPEKLQVAGIYVHPTEAAWDSLYARESSFYTTGSKDINLRKEIMMQKWVEYLTEEKARTLAVQCDSAYDCEDGTIYLLDEIGQDFVNLFHLPFEISMYGEKGLMELDAKTKGPDTIVCSESLNVPGNTYYKFMASAASTMPKISYQIDQPLLRGKEYEVEIVMAPDAENDTLPLPAKLRISYVGGKSIRLENTFETSVNTCDTLKYKFSPTQFEMGAIMIESRASSREVNKTHTRDIRLAIIKVRTVDEEE